MPKSKLLTERFWEKVDRRGPNDCWLWTKSTNGRGYGYIREGVPSQKLLHAHRVSWELANGPIPAGLQVHHERDNPLCVNPSHLSLGTQQDNVDDMMKKNRGARPKGEQNGRAKLTEEQVAEIRRDYVRGSQTHGQHALGRKYDVDHTTIGHIVREEHWNV